MYGLLLSYPETSVFFALAVAVMVVVFWFKGSLFCPATLYFVVQMVMLGIAYLKLDTAMTDFRLHTWLVWGGGLVSFLCGCFSVNCAWRMLGGGAPSTEKWTVGRYDWKAHFALSFLAFGFFMIGVIGVVSIAGNLVLLTKTPSVWLSSQHSDVLSYAFFFTSSPMVVGLFSMSSFKSINPIGWIRLASKFMVVLTIALSFMTFPSRGVNMICIGVVLILANYFYMRIGWKQLVVVIAFVAAFFVAVASLKGQYGDTDIMDSKMAQKVVLLPYQYVANNYWNLDYAFNRPSESDEHPWTYGVDAFFGLTQMMMIGSGLQESFGWDTPFNERVTKKKGLNTIPYLWDAYKDFGYAGIFLLPFFFGMLFTYLYRKLRTDGTPFLYLMHAVFSIWILLWNFTTGYKQGMYWIWMAFFFVVCSVSGGGIRRRRLPVKASAASEEGVDDGRDDQVPAEGGHRDGLARD